MKSTALEALQRIRKTKLTMDEEGMKGGMKHEKEEEKGEGEALVSIEIVSEKKPGKKKNPLDALK